MSEPVLAGGDFVALEVSQERREEPRTPIDRVPVEVALLDLPGQQTLIAGDCVGMAALGESRDDSRTETLLPMTALLLDEPQGPSILIECRDISRTGMGFRSSRAFRMGEHLAVHFHFAQQPDRLVLCRVCHCSPLDAGGYQAGAEFLESTAEIPPTEV